MSPDDGNRAAWEARSQHYGVSWRSVLFKGLPDGVNAHLHQWHTQFLLQHILPKPHLRILDVGCGYGRLTLPILQQFPDAEVVGMDISATFVDLFQQTTSQKAILGSLEALPPCLGQFDYILCVTVLMYVQEPHLQEALQHLLDLLRPGGALLLIENDAVGVCCAFGLLSGVKKLFRKEAVETTAQIFKQRTIRQLVAGCQAVIGQQRGLPFTTFSLLPLTLLFAVCPRFFVHEFCLWILAWLDQLGGAFPLPSLYVGYVIMRRASSIAPSH
jgi:2-polyprenyl-3-methyl-5-hydroxy-6-metoxy-1,4-benzoquinol methylase